MKFSINRLAFLSALKKVNGIILKTPVLPILTGIRLELKDDVLTLITSDGVISIKEKVESTKENDIRILAEGGVVLESRFLVDGISKLDSESVTLEVVSGSLTKISGGSAKFNINGSEISKYPAIDFKIADKQFNIESSLLTNALNRTMYACGINLDRQVFNGLNISLEDNKFVFVGTNSYRISRDELNIEIPLQFNIIVPLQVLYEVKKNMNKTITVSVSNQEVTFKSESVLIKSRLIEGIYPSISKAIKKDFSNNILIDRRNLISAIERSGLMKNESSWTVTLTVANKIARLVTKTDELGSTDEELEVIKVDAADGFVKFDGQYILDALKVIENEKVNLKFGDSMSQISIEDIGDKALTQIVMPLNPEA